MAPTQLDEMTLIRGGAFRMGSEDFYPEESPVHEVEVGDFWMDEHPVTAAQFRRFVRETGYVTVAERPLDPDDYPGRRPRAARAGIAGLPQDAGAGAAERCPQLVGIRSRCLLEEDRAVPGRRSTAATTIPVVQVAYEDAEAYAAWAGKELPTEAEWEYAARGGLDGAAFAWGDEQFPDGKPMANTWQGEFPWQNLNVDGFEGTSPVGSFPPNGYGLYDMCGNVWEWTTDSFTSSHADSRRAARRSCSRASGSRAR